MIEVERGTLEDKIRAHAHALWMAEGQPEGRAEEHWRLAQDAIEAEHSASGENEPGGADPSLASTS
jgi:hypothetical protein